MDNLPGNEHPPDEMSFPRLLNSLEFPRLETPSRPETLILSSNLATSSMTNIVVSRASSKKRHINPEEEQESEEESLLLSTHNSGSKDSFQSSTSPVKKSRKLSYRDPPPVLQSLDSETFKNLFESPTLSDSQNSESGPLSSSWSSPGASTNNYENLASLGDIIQRYSVANLNSMQLFQTHDNCPISSTSALPESTQNKPTSLTEELPNLITAARNNNLVNVPIATALPSLSCVSKGPVVLSRDLNDNGVEHSNLMSLDLDNNNVSNETLSNLALPNKLTDPATCEEFISATTDNIKPNTLNKNSKKNIDNASESSKPQDNKTKSQEDVKHDESTEESDFEDEENVDCFGPEVFVSNRQKNAQCKKNSKHLNFYSIPELQVKHLPEEIRHEDSVTFLSCLSQLVVQITVHCTSGARGPNDMYSSYIGTSKKRNGSGFVASVDDDIRKYRCRRDDCPYEECNSSFENSGSMVSPNLNKSFSSASTSFDRSISNISTASSSSGSSSGGRTLGHFFYSGVRIRTNKHIIYDKTEADNAYIKFFYNTAEEKEVVHGHVAAIAGVNTNQDHVVLHVMSHDKSLFTTLGMCLHNARSSYTQMLQSTDRIPRTLNHKQSWVAIVAHPHGLTKNITFGRIVDEKMEYTRVIKYYDAPTCPGSSGGLVITPSLLRLQWPGAVHSCSDPGTGYNITFDSRFPDLDPKDMGRIHTSILSHKHSYPEDIFKLS